MKINKLTCSILPMETRDRLAGVRQVLCEKCEEAAVLGHGQRSRLWHVHSSLLRHGRRAAGQRHDARVRAEAGLQSIVSLYWSGSELKWRNKSHCNTYRCCISIGWRGRFLISRWRGTRWRGWTFVLRPCIRCFRSFSAADKHTFVKYLKLRTDNCTCIVSMMRCTIKANSPKLQTDIWWPYFKNPKVLTM